MDKSKVRSRRKTAPWKNTDKDRGYVRRKRGADERLAAHVYDPTRCGPNCPKRS